MRVKQFEDHIESYPDYITLRNHIGKTVAGDGKRIMLMNTLWRLLKAAYNLPSGGKKLEPEPETPDPQPGGDTAVAIELPSL